MSLRVDRLLVPVDFSDCSRAALEYAIRLSAQLSARVEVLHACAVPPQLPPKLSVMRDAGRDPTTLDALALADARERMDGFLDRIERSSGLELGVCLKVGDPLAVILEAARDDAAIVIGTHGRTGLAHFVLGSVAEKVLRHARTPVFTVRGHSSLWSRPRSNVRPKDKERPPILSRVLVAVDFSSNSRTALQFASALAERSGASIDVVHAVTHVPVEGADLLVVSFARGSNTPFKEWARGAAREEMDLFLATASPAKMPQSSVIIGEPVETILELARAEHYDLVVLGTHGRTGFEHLLIGSVAEKIARRAVCPVLTIREPRPA